MNQEEAPIDSRILNANQKGFMFLVRHHYPDVWSQRVESCMANSMTQMLTTIYRIKLRNPHLMLSPRPLLSVMTDKGVDPHVAADIIKNHGLEEHVHGQRLFEVIQNFSYTGNSPRYKVKGFLFASKSADIVRTLKDNFGPGGCRYPLIGVCYPMGPFAYNEVASKTSMLDPYRWGASNSPDDILVEDGYGIFPRPDVINYRSVLITGLHTMADNPRVMDLSVEVKNSRGIGWGGGGYAWVTPDIFRGVGVPTMDGDI